MPPGHEKITVAYPTSTIRNRPVEVFLTPADGVYKTCVVNLDAINTIPKRYLKYVMCTLSPAKMDEVKQAILRAFGKNESIWARTSNRLVNTPNGGMLLESR
jgi:mRNA-degrading endonuclease toxin of MazEF toxin-antitoxin module